MANAKKLPSGSWRVNAFIGVDENGKQIRRSFTAPTKREAELMAAQYLTKKHHEAAPENMTLGQAIDKYIESKSNILSPSTIRMYKFMRNSVFQSMMDCPVQNISNIIVQKAVNEYALNHSPKTVRNALGLVTAALSVYAPEFKLSVLTPQKKKPDIRIPTDEDVQQVLMAAKGTNLELPILLAALLGLRRSEISGLRWNDVDFKKHTITIKRAVVYGGDSQYKEKSTKSTAGTRTLTVSDSLMERLQQEPKETEFVCPMRPTSITHGFEKILKQTDVPPFRFHDLRHYYASVLLALNIPNKYAQRRMGHATDGMLKKVYQHLMDEKITETDEKIGEHFKDFIPTMNTKIEHEI